MANINLQQITIPSVPGRDFDCFTPPKGYGSGVAQVCAGPIITGSGRKLQGSRLRRLQRLILPPEQP